MKKRVLIMSASAGSGHVRCGEALAKAFGADVRTAEVIHEDALKYTNKLFRDFYSTLYAKLVRSAPQLLGFAYRASDEPWKNETVRLQFDRLNTRPLVKFIQEFDPHITVCTHFMPAGIISHLIEKGELGAHLSIVVTDLDCHAMWLSRLFHRYFVALDETKAHLQALGLPGERISVSGIPIDPIFGERVERAATRVRFGLAVDKTTLLVSAGTLGVGPTEVLVRRLIELRHPVQTVVVCGKSEELRAQINQLVGVDDRFRVLGYTTEMHQLMQMSDLFVGKPGGLTTSEALACGLPMVIVSPIPGQEERNSDHLLEEGAAIRCNEMTTVPFKLERLLSDPERLARMAKRAAALGRPGAARSVVERLIDDELPPLFLHEEQREAIALAAARE